MLTLVILAVLATRPATAPTSLPSPQFLHFTGIIINPDQIVEAEYSGACVIIRLTDGGRRAFCEEEAERVWRGLIDWRRR